MRNRYILIAISFFVCFFAAGCNGSDDSAAQNVTSSAVNESSRTEDGLSEENVTSEADSQPEIKDGSETITSDSAENIALNNWGIDRDEVKYIHSYEEHDGGSIVAWCVEFEVNDTQYSCYVDMTTGEILKVFEEQHD